MAWETKSDFEFTAKGAEIQNVPGTDTYIKRVYFYTDDTPKGQVTIKPLTDIETENGILKTIPDAPYYTLDTLPENVVKAMQKANEMDEVTLVCTVTRAHTVTGAQDQGEEPNFFIRDENMKTLEVQLIQDESGEV
jgi:hypothetical protein